jgi:hypothetical protein
MTFIILPYLSIVQITPMVDAYSFENAQTRWVKNEKSSSAKEDLKPILVAEQEESKPESIPAIEEYEKQKLNRLKRNIGRKFLVPRTVKPVTFYEKPESSSGKISYKEKEGIVITNVVENSSGMKYFYQVKFDSGKIGFMNADPYVLDILVREGNLIPTGRVGAKRSLPKEREGPSGQTVDMSSEAVEMVKNHVTTPDPVTGERKTVEKRMHDAKSKFPNLVWRYAAKEIAPHQYRVTQYSEGGLDRQTTRTWIVDLHQVKVTPENTAARRLYP